MKLFDLPQGHGNTWFVDTIPIIEALDKDDHDFLQQCMIEFPWYSIPQEGANVLKTENIKLLQPVVQPHWLTNKSVPRCFFNYNPDGEWLETPLVSVSDRKPTEEEVIKFKRILAYIINETKKSDNLLIHQWQEGDVLIADLHKLAHTVKGGIDPDKREFRGLWGYWKNWNINPRIDIEKRIKLKNETY
jgi:alpha-ketoglutarate-dependent taurine dioxygenase